MPFKNPHPLYSVWRGMKRRCSDPNAKHYQNYGGRGITVCGAWESDFHAFCRDMGPRPTGWTLDRIDNNSGYSPQNCRWADRTTQARNKRVVREVSIEGVTYRVVDLADISGLKTDTIVKRAARGLCYNDVISPKRTKNTSGFSLGGRASGARKQALTHCKNDHEFTEDNTYVTKEGWRSCRKCHAIRQQPRNKLKRLNSAGG